MSLSELWLSRTGASDAMTGNVTVLLHISSGDVACNSYCEGLGLSTGLASFMATSASELELCCTRDGGSGGGLLVVVVVRRRFLRPRPSLADILFHPLPMLCMVRARCRVTGCELKPHSVVGGVVGGVKGSPATREAELLLWSVSP